MLTGDINYIHAESEREAQERRIFNIVALKTAKLRGQAWVVFSEVPVASNAVRQTQNSPFYDKPMAVNDCSVLGPIALHFFDMRLFVIDCGYNMQKLSDCVAKADGTFVARDGEKKQDEKALFQQYPGFREVRMIEAKPGIAFVEFEDDVQSSVAMQALQGFKITPQNPMAVTYAKK
ncbi:hypothetical protein TEA_025466 [Camellia sinensis var. sinensis]|uniref:RRM domain-containing protein n=1 Tax=Camellia sinensis var. sinensis TaxID=542762 RepID=A0A4S4E1Y9_CAMSN|nr:hypothetical protein TEA_025466 [Camellia sinensis var. sinensis]